MLLLPGWASRGGGLSVSSAQDGFLSDRNTRLKGNVAKSWLSNLFHTGFFLLPPPRPPPKIQKYRYTQLQYTKYIDLKRIAGKQGRLKNTKLQTYKIPRFEKVAGKVGTSVDGGLGRPHHTFHTQRLESPCLHCTALQFNFALLIGEWLDFFLLLM